MMNFATDMDTANGESAENHYHLGMLNLESADLNAGVAHATRAYDLGYPLPGLREKLLALGRWPGNSGSPDTPDP